MAVEVSESYITQYLLDAAERGTMHAAKHVQSLARDKAPVRKIFAAGRGEARHSHSVETVIPSKFNHRRGPVTVSIAEATGGGSPWKMHTGRLVESSMRPGIGIVTKGGVRGRVNSYAPVVQSPAGFIGGAELRAWNGKPGSGRLSIQTIKNSAGSHFSLSELLTTRGRYEVTSGRALHAGTVGGRLRAGITTSGPFRDGYSVYSLVSAEAHEKGKSHNYARDQEFGSRHNRKHPFMRPSLMQSKGFLTKSVRREIESGRRPRIDTHGGVIHVLLSLDVHVKGIRSVNRKIDRMLDSLG